MLPVYTAIAINQKAIRSGSSKPCLMTVVDETGKIMGEFVVKIFKLETQEIGRNTNKEVYGHVLARAFNLNTPPAALVRVNRELIDILNSSPWHRNSNLHPGVYFATKYLENAIDFSVAALGKVQEWEVETVFAFDVLIRNVDRRVSKPNLFFQKGELYLIDHELCLQMPTQSFLVMAEQGRKYWNFINMSADRTHLFFKTLQERNKDSNLNFATFLEYLRTLKPYLLDEYAAQLASYGYETDEIPTIQDYLTEVKNNSHLFVSLLKTLLGE